ncbi:MAG: hypothetical protein JWM05_79, partial [Acidimicrobiales bacterium]|nr:hypothetical protein [Acidimicrobiales bacterium]
KFLAVRPRLGAGGVAHRYDHSKY